MYRLAIPAGLLLLAGCVTPAEEAAYAEREQAQLAKELAGLTPGEPQRCVQSDAIQSIDPIGNTLLLTQGRGKRYTTEAIGCSSANKHDVAVIEPFRSREYCEGDLVRFRSQSGGFVTGSCSLGSFTPYSQP